MQIDIDVSLKDNVLDPQGQAILNNLHLLGFENVAQVRCRKVFECHIDTSNPQVAEAQAHKMCQALLVNQVIEDYQVVVHEVQPSP